MDRNAEVWDLNSAGHTAHMSNTPTYTLAASHPVRHARWRPGYECELALVSNVGLGCLGQEGDRDSSETDGTITPDVDVGGSRQRRAVDGGFGSDAVEIWDVRKGWLAKWVVPESTIEGGVTASWDAAGTLTFIADDSPYFEAPYDDLDPATAQNRLERGLRTKALGYAVHEPHHGLGFVGLDSHPECVAVFERLTKRYIIDGPDKHAICGHNTRVASETPSPSLTTSLTSPTLPRSHSAPAALLTVNEISSAALTTHPSRRATTNEVLSTTLLADQVKDVPIDTPAVRFWRGA
ncbi:unnamed protein product [Peniophora sp. CBMAI 1063]|nr:unnamed protein product [Peniophora sp. CBMAI 1063]